MSTSLDSHLHCNSSGNAHTIDGIMCCRHMVLMQMQTSRTKKNLMRRFMTCPFRGKEACGMFVWLEPPLEGRTRDVAIECLYKIARCKTELAISKSNEQKLKRHMKFLVFLCITLIVLFVIATSLKLHGPSKGVCNMKLAFDG